MNELISLLQRRHLVWHGSEQSAAVRGQTSGYAELDEKLSGGWPEQGVVDIGSNKGIGELRLVLPYLKSQKGFQVLINPPGQVCAEQLHHYGVDIRQVLIVMPDKATSGLWAAEHCLKSGSCGAVLVWLNDLEVHQVKRLQLASETGNCPLFMFRNQISSGVSVPVTLGLTLTPHDSGLTIAIRKRKGGWPVEAFHVDMRRHWPAMTISRPANVLPFPIAKAI